MTAPAILNVRYGLRSHLQAAAYRATDTSIPKEALTAEPTIAGVIRTLAAEIAANPSLILRDEYTAEERQADWRSLVKKVVVLPVDARSRPGHKILDHHMQHFYDVMNHSGVSVRQLAADASAVEKALWANLRYHSTPYKSEIRRMLTMTAGMSNVTKYRAATAKGIVTHFGARRVLDPCVGWGGRMLGALAAGAEYVGFEPDPLTFAGLQGVLGDLPVVDSGRATLHCARAEAAIATVEPTFDMVLTSPPYFNLEQYVTAAGQSVTVHPTWEGWRDEWLRPLILACLGRLATTGVSCWSVKNFRTDRLYPLADVVKEIHKEAGWDLVFTASMVGSARQGRGRIVDGAEGRGSDEETFCFRRR